MSKFGGFVNKTFPSSNPRSKSKSKTSCMNTADEQVVPQSSRSFIEPSLGQLIINHLGQRTFRTFQEDSKNFPNNFSTTGLVNDNYNNNNTSNDLSSNGIFNNTVDNTDNAVTQK